MPEDRHHHRTPGGIALAIIRFLVITAAMMAVGWALERLLDRDTFDRLAHQQQLAIGAVGGINPLDISDRFICALTPSVADMNRKMQQYRTGDRYTVQLAPASDCGVRLSHVPPAPGAPLPTPVVGHWGDGMNGLVLPFMAFLDTAWHLVVQPSLFASVFSLFAVLAGAVVAGALMMLPKFAWPPYIGATIFAVGTVAASCLVAYGLKEVMAGGLYLFGGITHLAGACCGASGVIYLAYHYVIKMVEGGVHAGIEHIIPH